MKVTPIAHQHYQNAATVTAPPEQLVLMLFDNLLSRLNQAESAIIQQPPDLQTAHHTLVRCQQIVDELRVSLDTERGGAVAANLANLYAFCAQRLIDANIKKEAAPITDVAQVIGGLRRAWAELCAKSHVPSAAAG